MPESWLNGNGLDRHCQLFRGTVHYPAMLTICPHCQAAYKLGKIDEGTILVCHRCGTEFSPGQTEDTTTGQSLASAKETHVNEQPLSPPPPHTKAHIMPWLLTIILLVTVAGIWSGHDTWMNSPWLRSVLINTGLPLEVRNRDWRIQPGSVQAQWIKRNDGSLILVIEGRVKNLLQCELIPPAIHFSIFTRNDPKHLLLERNLLISQLPLTDDIRRVPYVTPPEDRVPVTALGELSFVLVLANMPKSAGDFTLSAIAGNPG